MGALQPGLEFRDRAVGAGQDELAVGARAVLQARPVVEAGPGKPAVAAPAVGVDDRARLDDLAHPARERIPVEAAERVHAQAPGARSADLDRDADERLTLALAAATTRGMAPADVGLIDLDLAPQRLRSGLIIARRSFCRISQAVS